MPDLEDVRRELDRDELNYPQLARELGPEALPQLEALVAEDEPRVASKAAYLAGVIAGPTSSRVVSLASDSRHDVVRVAAAATATALPADEVAGIVEHLMADPDVGVRARAARSAAQLEGDDLRDRLQAMARNDDEPALRELAAELAEPSG